MDSEDEMVDKKYPDSFVQRSFGNRYNLWKIDCNSDYIDKCLIFISNFLSNDSALGQELNIKYGFRYETKENCKPYVLFF